MTCVPGKSCCTACANRWAVEWRIISIAASSRSVRILSSASFSITWDVSTSRPSTTPAKAALASPGPISAATSNTETGVSKDLWEPSGRVTTGMSVPPFSGDHYQRPRAKGRSLSDDMKKSKGQIYSRENLVARAPVAPEGQSTDPFSEAVHGCQALERFSGAIDRLPFPTVHYLKVVIATKHHGF